MLTLYKGVGFENQLGLPTTLIEVLLSFYMHSKLKRE
jgi:hypothetical protein